MKKVYIYALTEPNDENAIRYIGKTQNLKQRFKLHLKEYRYNQSYKNNWIKGLVSRSLQPIMIVLDEVDEEEWEFWEIYYVDLYKSWGFKLTNSARPGKGGSYSWQYTDEIKSKLRQIYYVQNKDSINSSYEKWEEEKLTQKHHKDLAHTSFQEKNVILCINSITGEIIQEFKNMSIAAKELNIPTKRIEEIVNKREWNGKIRKSYHNFTFIRKKDFNDNTSYIVEYKRRRGFTKNP